MRRPSPDRSTLTDRKGAAAVVSLLIVPAVLAMIGVAVDAGHLFLETQKIKSACRSAAAAAFEHPLDQADRAGAVGVAALRLAGIQKGEVRVTMDIAAGRPPRSTATASGIKLKTILCGLLSGGSWEWTLDGISARATRRPIAVSLVMDTSGSMCNTRPFKTGTPSVYLDTGDGMLPREFYENLAASGGMDFLSTKEIHKTVSGKSVIIKYNEVPAVRMWDPERMHSCTSQEDDTWFQDYVREAKRFVRSYLVDGYDSVGVVTFNWGAREERAVLSLDAAAVENLLDTLTAGGQTNLAAGIRLATDQLLAVDPDRYERSMILFTEGGANVMHARFTDTSSPAQASDPAFRYDPSSPSADVPPSYTVPTSTIADGRGSIYKDETRPGPKEYIVLFNPSPFDRWVFEKRDPSDPEITFEKLKPAACSGPNYLHKYTPEEPPQGSLAPTKPGSKPYEPGQGGVPIQVAHSVVYGTYAIERCFDSYDFVDWDGNAHSSQEKVGGEYWPEIDLNVPTPNYELTTDTKPYPNDPFIQSYMNSGSKLLRYDAYEANTVLSLAAQSLSLQPTQMALYEADRAKSPPNRITIHSLSYGFVPPPSSVPAGYNIYTPYGGYMLSGNDHLSVKRGHRLGYRNGYIADGEPESYSLMGFLDELTNYANAITIRRPVKFPWSKKEIGDWETQARGHAVMFTPANDPDQKIHYFYFGHVNTAENDAMFSRYSANLFGLVARRAAGQSTE